MYRLGQCLSAAQGRRHKDSNNIPFIKGLAMRNRQDGLNAGIGTAGGAELVDVVEDAAAVAVYVGLCQVAPLYCGDDVAACRVGVYRRLVDMPNHYAPGHRLSNNDR